MGKVSPFSFDPTTGLLKTWEDNGDDTFTIAAQQTNETEILEKNKAMYTHNDGYTQDRTMQRVASIPLAVIEDYQSRGINLYAPENEYFLARILDDSDYRHFRTAPGQLGKKHRHI